MLADYRRWFRNDERESDEIASAVESAHAVVEFADTEYFKEFMHWLDEQRSRPVKVGTHVDMICSAARVNALLEVRSHLLSEVEKARRTVAALKE